MRYALPLVVGFFSWTFLEYVLHRWVMHGGKGRNEMSREHLQHHVSPSYFAPTLKKLAATIPAFSAMGALLSLPTSPLTGALWAVGITLGWMTYEVIHRRIHVAGPLNGYGRWARRHHLHHHFHAFKNHGVTVPLWDWVFGTLENPSVVRVPRKQAVRFPWLVDGEAIAARHADDYSIV